jgi:ADP-ribose pyrophosphatase YjhB (NUDIX family)
VHNCKGDSLNTNGYVVIANELRIIQEESRFREISVKVVNVSHGDFDQERYRLVLKQQFTTNDHCRVLTIPKGKKEMFDTLRQTCIKEAKQETQHNIEEQVEHAPFIEDLKPTPKGTRYHRRTLVLLAKIKEVRDQWLMPQENSEIESCHFVNEQEVMAILDGGATINTATRLTLEKLLSESLLKPPHHQ